MAVKQPVMLIIQDGYGYRRSKQYNAVALAKTPNFDHYWKKNPHTLLHASDHYVGLPDGFPGNSEVGHENLGAGRIVDQDMVRVNKAIRTGEFYKNKVLMAAIANVKKNKSNLHLMGLLSDGGVHSHIDHLFALLRLAKKHKIKNVYVHCFTDGRDVRIKSAKKYIKQLQVYMKKLCVGEIASIIGRYYSMDRDNRWNREHKAYDAMVNGFGLYYDDPIKAVDEAYKRGETDEFIKPNVIYCKRHKIRHLVKDNDSIIFFNFRSDRARQITKAFVQGRFKEFKRHRIIKLYFASLTQYDSKIRNSHVVFSPVHLKNILADVLDRNRIRQLRAAETEKYAHVTYFFNCGRESPFPTEDRILIPSPKVSTYDLKPEMSVNKIKDSVIEYISKKKFGFVLVNFANPDMVGHSGKLNPTIKAVESTDRALGSLVDRAVNLGYAVIITADHGNAEEMIGRYQTSHTRNKVHCILVNYGEKVKLKDGSISNIAPTVLKIMGLEKPKEMSDGLF